MADLAFFGLHESPAPVTEPGAFLKCRAWGFGRREEDRVQGLGIRD